MTPRKSRPNSTSKRVRTAAVADVQAPEEAQSKIQLGARIAETTHQQFKLVSVISGIDMQILVEQAIREFLANHPELRHAHEPKSRRARH
jgi:DNA-nicking Smr family endonuclease